MSRHTLSSDKSRVSDDDQADCDGSVPECSEPASAAGSVSSSGSSARSRTRSQGAICYEYENEGESERIRVAQDVDPSEPDSIQSVERDAREFDGQPPGLPVAASGERYEDCGEESPLLACPHCGGVTEVGRTCRRSRCPRCWQSWDFQRALDAGTAVEGERRYRYASGEKKTKYHHLVVSLPNSIRFARSDPLDAAFKLVMLLLAQVGVFAGYVVYHPWRIKKAYRGDVNGHESGNGDMTWSDILDLIESDDWTWEAVREEFLVYGPHFHAIVNASYVQGGAVTEAVEEQTGVVIHRITKGDSSVSLGNIEDLASATAYALSHAGLSWDEDNEAYRGAFRFFGSTANVERRKTVKDDVKAALREVAPDVLGVEFGPRRCEEEVVDEDAVEATEEREFSVDGGASGRATTGNAHIGLPLGGSDATDGDGFPVGSGSLWSSGNTGGFATDSWKASTGVSPSYLDEPAEAEADLRSRCGTKLAPIWAAEEWLADEEWVAERDADTLAELQNALAEYRGRGDRRVGTPPDVPDPPD